MFAYPVLRLWSAGKEYVVPFSSFLETAGIENGRGYEASQLIDQMTARFDEDQILAHPDDNGGIFCLLVRIAP